MCPIRSQLHWRDSTSFAFQATRPPLVNWGPALPAVPDPGAFTKSSAVSLLYPAGRRPVAADVRALMARHPDFSISLDPFPETEASSDGDSAELHPFPQRDDRGRWLELLVNGLTFDLTGLAPGPEEPAPPKAHSYGFSADDAAPAGLEAIRIAPGPHLAGAAAMLPVVRTLALLAARLAMLPETAAVVWEPARCWNAPGHYRDAVLRWAEGGVFPALGLTALASQVDGSMQSEGLVLFTGQELRLEPEVAADKARGAKLAVRLIHLLVQNGPLQAVDRIALPDGGRFRLEPSTNGRFVRVWPD